MTFLVAPLPNGKILTSIAYQNLKQVMPFVCPKRNIKRFRSFRVMMRRGR